MSEGLLKTFEETLILTLETAKINDRVSVFVICFPEMEEMIRSMKEFHPKEQYPNPKIAAANEIGAIYNFRIIIVGKKDE